MTVYVCVCVFVCLTIDNYRLTDTYTSLTQVLYVHVCVRTLYFTRPDSVFLSCVCVCVFPQNLDIFFQNDLFTLAMICYA